MKMQQDTQRAVFDGDPDGIEQAYATYISSLSTVDDEKDFFDRCSHGRSRFSYYRSRGRSHNRRCRRLRNWLIIAVRRWTTGRLTTLRGL